MSLLIVQATESYSPISGVDNRHDDLVIIRTSTLQSIELGSIPSSHQTEDLKKDICSLPI